MPFVYHILFAVHGSSTTFGVHSLYYKTQGGSPPPLSLRRALPWADIFSAFSATVW